MKNGVAPPVWLRTGRGTRSPGVGDDLSDRQLVSSYVNARDRSALETLVTRHGPMVWRVCRNTLRHEHDAADAFQATFLVLLRNAERLRKRESVSSWLFGVARRVSLKAVSQRRRKSAAERCSNQPDPLEALSAREACTLLEAEVARLPDKYRGPFVLCCLEGLTRDEAAKQLGRPISQVKNLLEQARERLRSRLAKRGLTLGTAFASAGLLPAAWSSGMPGHLIHETLITAGQFLSAESTARAASAGAIGLAQGVIRTMYLANLRTVFVTAASVGLMVAGLGWASWQGWASLPSAAPSALAALAGDDSGARGKDQAGDPLPDGVAARLGSGRLWHGPDLSEVAISSDGKWGASVGMDSIARIWDAETGKLVRTIGKSSRGGDRRAQDPFRIGFSPKGEYVAVLEGSETLRLYDFATGKIVEDIGEGQQRGLSAFAFAPDGKSLATGGKDGSIRIRELPSGKRLATLEEHRGTVTTLAFSADGKWLISGGADKLIRRWDLSAAEPTATILKGHAQGVRHLAATPDGRRVVSAASENSVWVWDVEKASVLKKLGLPNGMGRFDAKQPGIASQVAISPDGKIVSATAVDEPLLRWDWDAGKELKAFTPPARGRRSATPASHRAAYSADGKRLILANGNGKLAIWDVAQEKPLVEIAGHDGVINVLAASPDGKFIATGGADGAVCFWEPGGKLIRMLPCHDGGITFLLLSSDGKAMWTGGSNVNEKAVLQWDLTTFKQSAKYEFDRAENIVAASLSPDDAVLALHGATGVLQAFEVATQQKRFEEMTGFRGAVVRFSPDGERLLTLRPHGRDIVVRHLDPATSKEIRTATLKSPAGPNVKPEEAVAFISWEVAFSPDGRTGLTVMQDGALHLFDLQVGSHLAELGGAERRPKFPLSGRSFMPPPVVFSANGRMVAAYGPEQSICVWEVATAQPRCKFKGHDAQLHALAFSPDGRRLYSVAQDPSVLVWDVIPATPADGKLDPMQSDALWKDLSGKDAAAAFRALQGLAAHPEQAVALVKERLELPKVIKVEQIKQWLQELGSEEFKVRKTAETELEKLGEVAEPYVRAALADKPDLDVQQRLESILKAVLLDQRSVPIASWRAIELLEAIGTPSARDLLQDFAKGEPQDRVRKESAAAARRIERRLR